MYVCMYVCMSVRMYVCMYVGRARPICTLGRMDAQWLAKHYFCAVVWMQFQASQVFHTRDGAVCACRMLRRWMWISRALRKVIVGARVPVQGRSVQTSGCEPCVVCVPSVSPCQRNTPHIRHHVSASFVHTHIALERHKIWSCWGRSAPIGIMARPVSASVTTEESPRM